MQIVGTILNRKRIALDPGHRRHKEHRVDEPRCGRPLLVVRLRGSQSQMGAQHGEITRQTVGDREALQAFFSTICHRLIAMNLVPMDRTRLGDRAAGLFLDRLASWMGRRRPEHFRHRSLEFFRSAGFHHGLEQVIFSVDLFQNLVALAARFEHKAVPSLPSCSTLMLWGESSKDGLVRQARNFDFPGIGVWDRAPAVVFCEPDSGLRYGFITTRGADVPVVTAFNEAGIVISTHTRFHHDVSFTGKGVVDLMHEMALGARCLDDAVEIASRKRSLSTYGIAVTSAKERRAVVVETNAKRISVVQPQKGQSHLTCANRYHAVEMQDREVSGAPTWALHSDNRELRMEQLVSAAKEKGGMDASELEALLGDHRDPEDPSRERSCGGILAQPVSVQSAVVEPDQGVVRVSVGHAPTGWGPFVKVPWEWGGEGFDELDDPAAFGVDSEEEALDVGVHRPAFVGNVSSMKAYECYLEACRIDLMDGSTAEIRRNVNEAVRLAPEDPDYRFLAGLLALQVKEAAAALHHLERGVETEWSPFRQGQHLLWGSRAAEAAGQDRKAKAIRARLIESSLPALAGHRAAAVAEEARPRSGWRLGRIVVQLSLLDAM